MIKSKNTEKKVSTPVKPGKDQLKWEKVIRSSTENAIQLLDKVFGKNGSKTPDIAKIKSIYRELFDTLVSLIRTQNVGLDYLYTEIIEPTITKNKGRINKDSDAFFNELINAVAIRFSVKSPLPLDTSKKVTFFNGQVKFLNSFRPTITNYTLIGTETVVSLKNNAHLTLIDDISKIQDLDHFEVIALKDTVQVVVGRIPDKYWKKFSLDHFMDLSKKFAKTKSLPLKLTF